MTQAPGSRHRAGSEPPHAPRSPLTVRQLQEPPRGFLGNEVEGEAFYRAFQRAAVDNFSVGYLQVLRGSAVVATVPYFITRYALNTTLPPGLVKRLLEPVRFRIACVGHPVADFGAIDGEMSAEVLHAVNLELQRKAAIVAYKDFPADLPLPDFSVEASLPVAVLALESDYWARLPPRVRAGFARRKRKAAGVRIEEHEGYPEALGPELYRLYLNAYERAPVTFERLNPAFFALVGALGRYVLYWEGDRLIGFCLLLIRGGRMHAKYMGMDYSRGRAHGLYFAMLLSHIDICLRDGLTYYNSGPTSYAFKQRLGSDLCPVYMYFRHRNKLLNRLISAYMRNAPFEAAPTADAGST